MPYLMYILDTLKKLYENPTEEIWETKNFHCLEIAPQNYLLTYTLIHKERMTRRSSWRRSELSWKIAYHQGAVV